MIHRRAALAPVVVVAALVATAPGVTVPRADSAGPAFVQQTSAHALNVSSLSATPTAALGSNDRLVVEVGVWRAAKAAAKTVTDSKGDTFTLVSRVVASDGFELSVWTAPVTAGAGSKPVVKATATAKADVGISVLEYSGLSTAAGTDSVDVASQASGKTANTADATTVSSGPTANVTAPGELALGFYGDSGFGDSLTVGDFFTQRTNVSPTNDVEMFVEDMPMDPMTGDTAHATVGTGPNTVWAMQTVVFKTTGTVAPTAPQAPNGVTGNPGDGSVALSWNAGPSGGKPITSFTVTPSAAGVAQTPIVVSGSPPATSVTVSGLTNGTSYTFTVSATNAVGTSPASSPSAAVVPAPNSSGQWTALAPSPIVAVHDMELANGTFLVFDGWQQPQPTYVFDPVANTYTETDGPDSIFCAGNAFLPDGRVITVGGYGSLKGGNLGIKDTAVFDPATSTWSRVADMKYDRWYPTLTELSDGRYVAISGNSVDEKTWADMPEVYDPTANTWSQLTNVNTSAVHEMEYPFSYLAPNGKVFTIGPSEDKSFILDVPNQTWTSVGSSGIFNGSSVMYRPGKILYSGGSPSVLSTTPSTNGTAVIDLTDPTPKWRTTSPMLNNRDYHTLTMLADGRVLAVGGEGTSDQTVIKTGVLPTEIWDPATETWTAAAPIAASRNYHSTAALMADGRVMVSGGGHPTSSVDTGQYSTQIYSPSYLFNGARPTITSASPAVSYNQTITVKTPDAATIGSVNLVSLAADTHQIDMNQHFVPLSYTAGSDGLSVGSPTSSSIAPPGNYMLFILNKKGVPSVAAPVRILATPPTAPAAPGAVTATGGNAAATVSWTAPTNGGSPVTSYTITPYVGSVAQPTTTVTGNPPATGTTVSGLTNGTTYTFTVTAANAVGVGAESTPSAPTTPAGLTSPVFVQATSAHQLNVTSVSATPTSPVSAGNRLVVEVGVWNNSRSTAASVTDSAGDAFTEVSHYVASDGTEQSVWTAVVGSSAGGARPTVKATATGSADIGVALAEYGGLSTAAGLGSVDVQAHATGTTSNAATVSSGSTTAAGTANELAVGFYSDSGFSQSITAGSGSTARVNVSKTNDMELLLEDRLVAAGATVASTAGTGAKTTWEMTTVVFKTG